MAALDTNVLVRFLIQDDAVQGQVAATLIHRSSLHGTPLFVPVTVFLELEWVLRSALALDKATVVQSLNRILGSNDLEFESEASVEIALLTYAEDTADFADCLHAALATASGTSPMWTFDKSASKLSGMRLLAST